MKTIVVLPGDGIGQEITDATLLTLRATGAPLRYEFYDLPEKERDRVPEDLLKRIRTCGVALKGPLNTPLGTGYQSWNVQLRKALDLYAGVRPARTLPGVITRYSDVPIDLVIIRENLQGLYSGIELDPVEARERVRHPELSATSAATLSTMSRDVAERIARYAFNYAISNGRKKVTIVHKANIAKKTSGMFLDVARSVAEQHPQIECEALIADNTARLLVKHPEWFDVLLCENHFGDLFSDLTAALVGDLGTAPSGQYGNRCAIFEAVHGTAPDIAGKNLANPTALMLTATMMLRQLQMPNEALLIEQAIFETLRSGVKTGDLGGSAGTTEFAEAVVNAINKLRQ